MIDPVFSYFKRYKNEVSQKYFNTMRAGERKTRVQYELLPLHAQSTSSLSEAFSNRRSVRDYSNTSIDKSVLSRILSMSLGQNPRYQGSHHFSFPSGGGFYLMETYLLIERVDGINAGVYHYCPQENSLGKLNNNILSINEFNKIFGTNITTTPAVTVLLTMVKAQNIEKYGSFAYPLSLLEAGHRGQNIILSCAATGVGACPIGGAEYESVHNILGVQGDREQHVYSVLLGNEKSESH